MTQALAVVLIAVGIGALLWSIGGWSPGVGGAGLVLAAGSAVFVLDVGGDG